MSKCCSTKLVYRYDPAVDGLNASFWSAEAGPHLDPLEWSGPVDTLTGFPLPSAVAPDVTVVNNGTNVTDSNSGLVGARYGIIDGWIELPDDATHLRDNNSNTGELGMVLMADCCSGALVEQAGGNHAVSTAAADRTLMDSVPVTGGWKYIFNPSSDSAVAHGLQLQYSPDNEVTWLTVPVRRANRPVVECKEISSCAAVPEGWQLKPLTDCCQPKYVPATVVPEQEVCTDLELPFVGNRRSWWNGWTDVTTENDTANVTYEEWTTLTSRVNNTGKLVDAKVNVNWGNWLHYLRRGRLYLWMDFRIVVNGTTVVTRSNDVYFYKDNREDTNPDVVSPQRYQIDQLGTSEQHRYNIPVGATVEVQTQARYRFAAFQTDGWGRLIGGLRAHASIDWYLQEVVTGRLS